MTVSKRSKTINEATIRRIRGSSFPMILAAARAATGESAWQDLLATLSPGARALAEAPPAQEAWLDANLASECMGRFMAAGKLGAVPGILGAETIRARNPEAFRTPAGLVAHLPEFWRGSVEGGVMEADLTGPTRAVVRLWAIWSVPYSFDQHLPAWMSHALRLAGATEAKVCYAPPSGACTYLHAFHLEWS
jgi:hypothetical protein